MIDNILIAYCLWHIHYLKSKKGKFRACEIKLDMAKAYDRVELEILTENYAAARLP
jgi:hypothetical protein